MMVSARCDKEVFFEESFCRSVPSVSYPRLKRGANGDDSRARGSGEEVNNIKEEFTHVHVQQSLQELSLW